VRTIVAILAAHVRKAEFERTRLKAPSSWQAYDYYLSAVEVRATFSSPREGANNEKARCLLQQSLASDPNFARSYASIARFYVVSWGYPAHEDFLKPTVLEQAHNFARKAVLLDRNLL
jgi:hypothetical protein